MQQNCDEHPVAHVQWVKRDTLHANDYNPNVVARTERALLKLSILEDGWTQPIVARTDGEIVDGFHRWSISADPDIFALTNGMVPVVYLPVVEGNKAHQMMSTIRHNRARGTHTVVKMADIVNALRDEFDLSPQEIALRLGMEDEEVTRLYERGNMLVRHGSGKINKGWVPG